MQMIPVGMLSLANGEASHLPDDILARKDSAQKEIERILQAHAHGQTILFGSNADERRVAFRHILLLLHPDLQLVSASDLLAKKALSLSLKAFVQSEATCTK